MTLFSFKRARTILVSDHLSIDKSDGTCVSNVMYWLHLIYKQGNHHVRYTTWSI